MDANLSLITCILFYGWNITMCSQMHLRSACPHSAHHIHLWLMWFPYCARYPICLFRYTNLSRRYRHSTPHRYFIIPHVVVSDPRTFGAYIPRTPGQAISSLCRSNIAYSIHRGNRISGSMISSACSPVGCKKCNSTTVLLKQVLRDSLRIFYRPAVLTRLHTLTLLALHWV